MGSRKCWCGLQVVKTPPLTRPYFYGFFSRLVYEIVKVSNQDNQTPSKCRTCLHPIRRILFIQPDLAERNSDSINQPVGKDRVEDRLFRACI